MDSLAKVSYYAFDVGTVAVAIAFTLFVVHTTALAVGRRVTFAPAAAGAGAGTGTTVTSSGPTDANTAGSIGQAFVWVSFVLIGIGLVVRGVVVGRGPWGNLYEF